MNSLLESGKNGYDYEAGLMVDGDHGKRRRTRGGDLSEGLVFTGDDAGQAHTENL